MSYPTARVTSRQDGVAAIEVYPRAYYRQMHYLPVGEAEQWIQHKLEEMRNSVLYSVFNSWFSDKKTNKNFRSLDSFPEEDRWKGYESEEYEPEEPLPSETMITEYDALFMPENKAVIPEITQSSEWSNVKRKYKKVRIQDLDSELMMQTPDSPK
jgi:hypothetical protein